MCVSTKRREPPFTSWTCNYRSSLVVCSASVLVSVTAVSNNCRIVIHLYRTQYKINRSGFYPRASAPHHGGRKQAAIENGWATGCTNATANEAPDNETSRTHNPTTRPHAHRARLHNTQTNQDSQPSNRPKACSRHRHKYSGSTGVLTCFTQAEDIQLASRLVPSSPSPLPPYKG